MTLIPRMRIALLTGAGLTSISCLGWASGAAAANDTDPNDPAAAPSAQQSVEEQAEDQEANEFGTDTGGGPGTSLDEAGENQIVVQGARLRGQLDVPQEPLLELGEEDIAAEGVASIADLVTQIQNQTGSARGRGGGGRPITLVNGIRVGSFRELFSYPPEALAKVEVFPEEVAQRFGFPPDRRVINLILKDNFASREVELEFEGPARGGRFVNEQELGYLKIAKGSRFNFNFTADDATLLTEDERDIIQTPGSTSELEGDPDQAEFRSLLPDRRGLETNLSWARAYLSSGISVSANAAYEREDTRFLDGVNLVTLTDPNGESLTRTFGENDPLERTTASDTGSLAGSLSAPLGNFRLTSTFDASLVESTTKIDNRFDTSGLEADALAGDLAIDGLLPADAEAGFETAFSRSIGAQTLNTVRGPLADLPGGELLTTFDIGVNWQQLESEDTRSLDAVSLTRRVFATGANVVIPITSRRTGFADALGSFTLNAQVGIDDVSDFGTLGDYNVSLNWEPTDGLNLSTTYIYREVAPGLGSLGNPQITNFNVPVFDFVNGETVLATVTTGGNPDLPAETQRDWKFAVNWELPFVDGARFTVEYIRNRSDDVTSAFPQITEEIEAAFPDRITRDASGTLVALDRRPVSFSETRADRLQFRLSKRGGFGQGSQGGRGGRGGPPSGARGRSGPPAGAAATPNSPPAGASGPPSGGAPASGRPPRGAGVPPNPERRAAFMAFREKLCAEDGLDLLKRIAAAAKNGEDLSTIAPGLPPRMIERILSRLGGADGDVSDEQLEQARTMICSREPGRMGGPPGQTSAGGVQAGGSPSASGGPGGAAPPAANRGGGRPRGGNPFTGGGRRGWRYFANLTHTIELQNEILIAPGVQVLDQLDGDATGAFGFPRHSSRLEAGLFGNGLGFRLSGRYTGETRLDGSGTAGSSDLFFDDLATFDLRVFTNIDQLTGSKSPAFKNLRVSLRMDNIFDAQRSVRDENGDTPINYQPFVIDPVGRFIGIDIRKLF